MIDKLRRKFSLFAIFSVFTFLTLILLTINIVNFSLVSNDADAITGLIKDHNGTYQEIMEPPSDPRQVDPMRRDSPEMKDSLRYFTVKYDNNNVGHIVEYKINAFSKGDAIALADSLKEKSTGWVDTVYRFRTWISDDKTTLYVTVIDQSRELRPCYNVLNASVIGGLVGLAITVLAVIYASKRFVRPIEEADNKQKRFIANASISLRTPISIMSFDNATLVRENGMQEPNKSIDYQLKKMLDLANDLNAFSLIATTKTSFESINISNVTKEVITRYRGGFNSNHKTIISNIEDNVVINADLGMMQKMLSEILENCLKYSDSTSEVKLYRLENRVVMEFKNDCNGIPEGTLDRVFDRFYRLDYKDHSIYEGSGIGLAIAKDIVDKHKGRIIARGENGNFVLKIEL